MIIAMPLTARGTSLNDGTLSESGFFTMKKATTISMITPTIIKAMTDLRLQNHLEGVAATSGLCDGVFISFDVTASSAINFVEGGGEEVREARVGLGAGAMTKLEPMTAVRSR